MNYTIRNEKHGLTSRLDKNCLTALENISKELVLKKTGPSKIESERDDILQKFVVPDLEILKSKIEAKGFRAYVMESPVDYSATLTLIPREEIKLELKTIYTPQILCVNVVLTISGTWYGHGQRYEFLTHTPSSIILQKHARVLSELIEFANSISISDY